MLASMLFTSLFVFAGDGTEPCTLRPTHGTPLLVGDVPSQKIALKSSGNCASLSAGSVLIANSSDNTKRASGNLSGSADTWTINVMSAIATSDDAERPLSSTWNIYTTENDLLGGGSAAAQLFVDSIPVRLESKTTVVYKDYPLLTEIVALNAKPADVAYAGTRDAGTNKDDDSLMNVTVVDLPFLGMESPTATWTISATGDVQLLDDSNPQVIKFRTHTSSLRPLKVKATRQRSNDEEFTLAIQLAASAEPSSVPLNIADLAYVLCQRDVRIGTYDVIRSNRLAAVANPSVTNGRCMIVISKEDIDFHIARAHGIPVRRYQCKETHGPTSFTMEVMAIAGPKGLPVGSGSNEEGQCEDRGAAKGEEITLIEGDEAEKKEHQGKLDTLKRLYGQQRATVFVYSDPSKREASRREFFFSAGLEGRREIPIGFGDEQPSQEQPIHIEIAVQPASDRGALPKEHERYPERTYSSTLRPKGPFGVTHRGNSLGSKSVRFFATVPVDFTAVRFPSAGLDLKSSKDPTAVQISTLTTGLLLTVEPWDYTRGVNMLAVPMRFQLGMLMSNWYKAEFQPSTYLGGAITLPLFRGTTQLDTDLALGVGWEVDLRSGYDSFAERNHLLVTLGVNIFSLFGPQSSPRKK